MVVVVVVVAERPSTFPMQNLLPCYNIQACIIGCGINSLRSIARIINSLLIIYTVDALCAFMGNLNAR